ncbi:uncharacterized protein LOC136071338 [Quercus suber]|uniref:uncharacterized protein LOC136071338 n=1 Tax=Quercus suber TaxID=58331 RepID=UPI0032DE9D04
MSNPEPDEVLFAYIVVAPCAVSLVLIRVDQDVQMSVYYVSKSLHEAEIRYLPLEKAILAVVLGLVLISPEKIVIEKSMKLNFTATNNEAEYETLLMGMAMIRRMGGKSVESEFDSFNFLHIPRNGNAHADSLATLATSLVQDLLRVILVEDLHGPIEARREVAQVHQIRAELSWMDPIIKFLKEDTLPEERGEADKVLRKATRFWLSENQKLYKRSYLGPYLLCMHPKTAELLLKELYEGICGSHTGGRSLSHQAITQGYWWPNMQKEAHEYVKECNPCQRFAPNIYQPGGTLNLLSSSWHFAQWGLDIVGPFLKAKFVWKNIVTRFGIPHTLISDNGLQFDSKAFRNYCSELGITNRYSTSTYPQGNGQAETVNKVIVNGLKKRLDDAKGKWVEELPHVLWAYRTTPRRSTRETSFSMIYGAEAGIPLETGFPTMKTSLFSPTGNNEQLEKSLDLIEEMRENVMVRLAHYQQKLR